MIQAIRSTGNVLAARRVVDMSEKISVLEPDSAPLTQLTKKMGKKVAINPDFKWMEEESLVRTASPAATYTAGVTQISVGSGTGVRFRVGDVVKVVESGEQMLVTAVATDLLDVSKGYGTTSTAAIPSADTLLIIGNSNQEFATKRAILATDPVAKTNYTQIIRTPFGISRTIDNSELYGGGDKKHQRMMQLIEHQKDIERTFWFGEPKEDTTGTHPRRLTGGVDYWTSTNSKDASGTLTELDFEEFIRTGMRYGSKTKWLFAAPLIVSAINFWAKDKLVTASKDKTYGIDVSQYLSAFGMINIITMNLFAETTVTAGEAFLVDPESLKYRYLANSDTRLKTNIQDPSADGEEDEYISEVGLEYRSEKKGSMLYGATSYSA